MPNIFAGTDLLKDEVAASLLRDEAGERRLNISKYAPHEVLEEYCAERRGDKGWGKRPGVQRNEALDLSVYALALVIVLEAEAINWDSPPVWAKQGPSNHMAVAHQIEGETPGVGTLVPPEKPESKWVIKKPKRKW